MSLFVHNVSPQTIPAHGRWRQYGSLKCWYLLPSSCGITTQKTKTDKKDPCIAVYSQLQ
jgi:hypothetical protein